MSELKTSLNQPDYTQEIAERGLNNFHADISGGYRRVGFKDMPESRARRDSNIRMGKSMDEYWKDVDAACEQTGIDLERVKTVQEQMRSGKGNRENLLKELNQMLVPVYVRLREQGYTQWDLWS
ncbi:hypothetical protein HY345_02035 [Candidatus Microgenomates bacterium]|nr:hypothetical protein [Candidatus Microgenomates bacterium]